MWPVLALGALVLLVGAGPELWRAISGARYRRSNLYRSSHGMRRTSRGTRRYTR